MKSVEVNFQSIDRQSEVQATLEKPDRFRALEKILQSSSQPMMVRGAGVSYIGASFSSGAQVIDFTSFDRILSFNEQEGTIVVEAGLALGKLSDFLESRGWIVPVQPGYWGVTVGGAIAIDIFGKTSLKLGTFSNWVETIELLHPQKGHVHLSRQENVGLFDLTLGGYGLTGLILSAKLKLVRPPSLVLEKKSSLQSNLNETLRSLQEAQSMDMALTWNDFMIKGKSFGRGCVWTARWSLEHSRIPSKSHEHAFQPLQFKSQGRCYLNSLSLKMINTAYWVRRHFDAKTSLTDYHDFSYPNGSQAFYFSLFGKHGFIEKQILLPWSAGESFFLELRKAIDTYRPPLALASLKILSGERKLLRFSGHGLIVSLDIAEPQKHIAFLDHLDALTTSHGGLNNLAKDSHITLATVKKQYNEYELFRERLRTFDPQRYFVSEFSQRLNL